MGFAGAMGGLVVDFGGCGFGAVSGLVLGFAGGFPGCFCSVRVWYNTNSVDLRVSCVLLWWFGLFCGHVFGGFVDFGEFGVWRFGI